MHFEAFMFVGRVAERYGPFASVLDVGGRYFENRVRPLFREARYVAVDLHPWAGVDIVTDAAVWLPTLPFDCAISCEVFEHTSDWPSILRSMTEAISDDGHIILTMATDPRKPHSGFAGGGPAEDEFYRNVPEEELRAAMVECGLRGEIRRHPRGDLYVHCRPDRAVDRSPF